MIDSAPPLIYNLFPTLVGPANGWVSHAERARDMGFTWLYVNPFHYPGFSGSLYAVKDYYRLHPLLASDGDDVRRLAPVLGAVRGLGLETMMDLVINHTAKDSPLVHEHPAWYRRDQSGEVVSPSVVDPDDSTKVTVWGDLAEIDHEGAEDREGLWRYWEALVDAALDLGFTGFRCDAAYKIPAALWQRLIERAKDRLPAALFVAETLGCTLEETQALEAAGFDYFYNSVKWWDFEAPWALEQHERFRQVAPSIAFPESHDTPRLMAESGGSEAVQRQRYAFAAAFSAGVQTTVGYEYGFRRSLDVVATRPEDWEEPAFDLGHFLRRVNDLKRRHPLLVSEGALRALDGPESVTVLRRWSDDAGTHRGLILVNRDLVQSREVQPDRTEVPPGARLYRPCLDDVPASGVSLPEVVRLAPAEVALVMAAL